MTMKPGFWLPLIVLLLLATGARAQTAAEAALTARGEAVLRTFQNSVQTYTAQFSQAVYDDTGALKRDGRATGSVVIGRPGKFVWKYLEPYEQHLIADGSNLWSWDVDLDQISVRAQREALGQSPAQVLSGTIDALEAFDYQGALEQDGALVVQLAGRDQQSDFRVMRLAFRDEVLVGMRIGDSLGQTTDIQFTDVQINTQIAPDTFEFVPPDGVDVVGTPISETGIAPPDTMPATAEPRDTAVQAIVSGQG
ncbi:MAG: outer-membrane lipoprotein carrier protein LolA [Pseudomonadota bacterium]